MHDVVFRGVKVELVHSLVFRVVKMALELGLSVCCGGAYLRSTVIDFYINTVFGLGNSTYISKEYGGVIIENIHGCI